MLFTYLLEPTGGVRGLIAEADMLGQPATWDFHWGQVVARAWADEAFKGRLLAEPAVALAEYGLKAPPGTRIEVVAGAEAPESSGEVWRLALPARPSAEDLSEEELCGAGVEGSSRCGCERCSCERCSCERCSCERCACDRCGCHHPPRPETEGA